MPLAESRLQALLSQSSQRTALVVVALAAILLVNLAASWHWVRTNEVLLGNDASGYLHTSVDFAHQLAAPSIQTIFRLFQYDPYRPPLLYFAAQPFFWRFGVNMDSAQLVNVLGLGLVIILTYALGAAIGGRWVGLLAVLLVGLFPMMAAMARLFYTEMLLTATVALNLLALIRSQQFASRRWSLVWGASLGLGLLVKWTMPIYFFLPLVVQLRGTHFWRLGDFGLDHRRAFWSLVGALVISLFWFLPNRADAQTSVLGDGLFLGWLILFLLLFYAWAAPTTPTTNFWLALVLGATIASFWYLPQADFAWRVLEEDNVRGQQGANPLHPFNYWRNLRYFYSQHLGALAFWAIIPVVAAAWLYRWWRRRSFPANAALLWWSILSALVILGIISQSNERNLVPLLPGFAVLMALTLGCLRWQAATVVGIVWVLILGAQWTLFSFDLPADLFLRTRPLWAAEKYAAPPASGFTSPQYAIYEDVIQTIIADQTERQRLGMLVHIDQIHRGIFRLLLNIKQDRTQVVALTTEDSRGWYDMLSTQWVLVKDGDNHELHSSGLALVERILGGDPLFHALYQEVKHYPLPHEETVYLYHRSIGPGRPLSHPQQVERTVPLAETIRNSWSDQAHLLYTKRALGLWVGIHDPAQGRVTVLEAQDAAPIDQLEPLTGTLMLVWDYEAQALHQWLEQNAFRALEIGDDWAAVAVYGRPHRPLEPIATAAAWPDFRISNLQSFAQVQPGAVLPIRYEVAGEPAPGTKLSARLVDAEGALLASHDQPLQSGNRLGLLVPPDAQPGQYQVIAIVYDEATLAPIVDQLGHEAAPLFDLMVMP